MLARTFLRLRKPDPYKQDLFGVANPVFILDEIDKCSDSNQYPTSPALLSILEPITAKNFRDEYLDGITFDLTHSTFFMTANSITTLTDPLLSRLLVVDVPTPTHAEKCAIAQKMYVQRISDLGIHDRFKAELSPDFLNVVCKESLRTLQRDMFSAIDNALWHNEDANSIVLSVVDIHENTVKNQIGFNN
jgi:ATP-dependent Lon protease